MITVEYTDSSFRDQQLKLPSTIPDVEYKEKYVNRISYSSYLPPPVHFKRKNVSLTKVSYGKTYLLTT